MSTENLTNILGPSLEEEHHESKNLPVAIPGLLSPTNQTYIQLVRTLWPAQPIFAHHGRPTWPLHRCSGILRNARFHPICRQQLTTDYDASGLNLTVYAAQRNNSTSAVIINKDTHPIQANLTIANEFHRATVVRLKGPSLESKSGVTLGGSYVDKSGQWQATKIEPLPFRSGYNLHVPAASAAIVTLYEH